MMRSILSPCMASNIYDTLMNVVQRKVKTQ